MNLYANRTVMTKAATSTYFVDLDGSLLKSDLLFESLASCLAQNPFLIFLLPIWLIRGRSALKKELSQRAQLNIATLPYNDDVTAFLHDLKRQGRSLVLATAAHVDLAQEVARHFGIFDRVIASDGENNNKGKLKLKKILAMCPDGKFSYIGDSAADLPICAEAEEFVLVAPSLSVQRRAMNYPGYQHTIQSRDNVYRSLLKALRPHQWLKNLLVFVPLFTAQQWGNIEAIGHACLAFLAFSLCASGVYMLNDVLDLAMDRKHPRKRHRPFASGSLSLHIGFLFAGLLPLVGLAIGLVLPYMFFLVLGAYYITTVVYSLWAKKQMMLDVIFLAGLYTIRIIAGAVSISIVLSFWLLAFSVFLFLSLALVKRCTELNNLPIEDGDYAYGRGYKRVDREYLHSMGTASGYLAVLVLALFINSKDIIGRYTYPEALWFLCPVLLYWIGRLWLMVGRGKFHDDPIIFALLDRPSQIAFGIVLALIYIAI